MIDAMDDGATVYFDPDPGSYQRYFVVVGCDDSPEQGAISFSIKTDSAPFLLERVTMVECARVDVTR